MMVPANSEFFSTVHGSIKCETCHEGDPAASSKDGAHTGMIAYPSLASAELCGACHESAEHGGSIHRNLDGYTTMISLRSGGAFDPENPAYRDKFREQCSKCHTTCGQCHVSRPASVGGGFLSGHTFMKTPSILYNCTACHGSRVGEEYLGEREGYRADVHWNPGGKSCVYCHDATEMHVSSASYDRRYEVAELPRCEDCHAGESQSNTYHSMHWTDLQCNVCHSQDYKNCYSCHAGEGIQEPSSLGFKIGRNPLPSSLRGYKYVVLRHVPIAPETFSDWGLSLPNYSAEPTWRYASPHNIRRTTPQTDASITGNCYEVCHNSETLFLRASDLRPYEVDANQDVIVPDGPVPWGAK
ncbi:MAG: hypothetical protein Kow0074_24590 [Candidatus Zixiibacteriota bacterium]